MKQTEVKSEWNGKARAGGFSRRWGRNNEELG